MSVYRCPSDSRQRKALEAGGLVVGLAGYLGVSGTDQYAKDGVFFPNSQVTFASITDGLSNTLMAGERPPSVDLWFGWWFAGSGQTPDSTGSCDVVLGTQEIRTYDGDPYGSCPKGPYKFGPGKVEDPSSMFHYWSLHSKGSNFLLADGSVHFIRYSCDPTLLQRLGTINGGEVAGGGGF
jgi:prepilin-type processing-associated H-X9-DG protein